MVQDPLDKILSTLMSELMKSGFARTRFPQGINCHSPSRIWRTETELPSNSELVKLYKQKSIEAGCPGNWNDMALP